MGPEEGALLEEERIAAARLGVAGAAARSLVAAIEITDKAIHKTADDDLRTDLRAQRQQLVDALCGLSGSPCKVKP
jgi:hypothetical protein